MMCPFCATNYEVSTLTGTAREHDAEDCRAIVVKQRDEAVKKLDDVSFELIAVEGALLKAFGALRWYADPENNGKLEWETYEGVDRAKHRWIDEDEGEIARAALAKIEEAERAVFARANEAWRSETEEQGA